MGFLKINKSHSLLTSSYFSYLCIIWGSKPSDAEASQYAAIVWVYIRNEYGDSTHSFHQTEWNHFDKPIHKYVYSVWTSSINELSNNKLPVQFEPVIHEINALKKTYSSAF